MTAEPSVADDTFATALPPATQTAAHQPDTLGCMQELALLYLIDDALCQFRIKVIYHNICSARGEEE